MGQILRKRRRRRVTAQDLTLFKIKCIRDLIRVYQRKLEYTIKEEHVLTKKLIISGQREKARSLLRKKLTLKKYLLNADAQLENMEALIYRLEVSILDQRVIEGIKLANETLKKINEIINIKSVDKILLDNVEGLKKKAEVDEKIVSLNIGEAEIDLDSEFENILNENQETITELTGGEDVDGKEQNEAEVFNIAGPSKPSRQSTKKSAVLKKGKEIPLTINV